LSVSVNSLSRRLERIARELGGELESRLDDLAEQWYEQMTAIPELDRWSPPELRVLGLENARRDIGREISGLIAGRQLPSSCPAEVIESARMAEASGFPLWACVQSYRTGHAVQWKAWSEAVEARRLEPDARRALLEAGSGYMFDYADRCARWVEMEYTRERESRLRSQEQLRIQHVRDLLEGKHGHSSQLGYELTGWHIALIASGHEADSVLEDIGRSFDAQMLSIVAEVLTWWAWLRPGRVRPGLIERLVRSLSLPPGVSLAIGEPGDGPEGFRQSHLQAAHAAAVGARLGTPTTRYDDVALEALVLADLERARAFVSRELGPLAGDDRRAQTLRNTLRAYFAAGQTGSSTAVILGVHERTVGNRLRAVETLIDRSVLARRAELETALRIHALLRADDEQTTAGSPPPTPAT
jgi:hypothetical protein